MLIKGFQSHRLTLGLLLLLVVFIFQAVDSIKAYPNTDTNIGISLELLQRMQRERQTGIERERAREHSIHLTFPWKHTLLTLLHFEWLQYAFTRKCLIYCWRKTFHSIPFMFGSYIVRGWIVRHTQTHSHTEIFVCFNVNRILYICIDEMNMKHVHKRHDQSISEIKPKLVSFLL